MARIRTIKPDFHEDDRLANPSLQSILLYILMKNFCDDKGIILANEKVIKSKCFPQRDDVRLKDVSQWIIELKENSLLVPFEHEQKGYYALDFSSERIDKPQASIIRDETFFDDFYPFENILERSRTFPPDKERKGIGKERKGKGEDSAQERDKPPKLKFFENIFLTENEFEKLKIDYGESETMEAIEFLSNYGKEKPSNFKTYKDHNLTMRRWVFDAVKEKKSKQNHQHGNTNTRPLSAKERRDIKFQQTIEDLKRINYQSKVGS